MRSVEPIAKTLLIVIALVVLVGTPVMGSDYVYTSLLPLRALHIQFPRVMSYAYLIAPAISCAVWVLLARKFPKTGAVISAAMCVSLIMSTDWYASCKTDRVHLGRQLTSQEQGFLLSRLSFPFVERSTANRDEILVERGGGRRASLHQQLSALGVPQVGE